VTADHGRRALPWYDRRQPALLAAAARRAKLRSTPRLGGWLDIMDGPRPVACARFTAKGQLVSAWGLSVTGKRVEWRVAGYGTAREVLDKLTVWLGDGRPDTDVVQRLILTRAEQAAVDRINRNTPKGPDHMAEVLPFRPRSRK